MAALLVGALTTLQDWFDSSDRRRAVELALASQVRPETPTIGEMLARQNGGAPPPCTAAIASACSGVVRVECRAGAEPEPYRFTVHLLRRRADPDDATRRRIEGRGPGAPATPQLP